MLERGSITLLTVRGVPLRLHASAIVLVVLVAVGVAAQVPFVAEGVELLPPSLPPWAHGLIAAAGLLVGIALHEWAHTALALRYGGAVDAIVLMALGGVSHVRRMPARPRHELLMALAGPLCSLAIAAACTVGFFLLRGGPPDLALALFVQAYLNLILGVFNLIPALPMDGGRVLRAGLSGALGPHRATTVSARVAQVMAAGFVVVGLLWGGFFLLFIAAFVWLGASQELKRAKLSASLRGLRVGELSHLAPLVNAEDTLETARVRMRDARATSALVVHDGRTLGVLRRDDVLALPPLEREVALVRAHLLPVLPLTPSDPLDGALDRVLADREVPVTDDAGRALGVLSAEDVLRTLVDRNPELKRDQGA